MQTNNWIKIRNQSLASYTREAGYDLTVFNDYSETTRRELKKAAISNAIYGIKYAFEQQDIDIPSVKTGVYVIALSSPFTLQYKKAASPIIYIGIGNLMGRIKSHFENSLFDFMQSLSGTNFDFHFALPKHDEHADYYKHVEWQMLEAFSKKFGGNGIGVYPILNKNAGSKRQIDDKTDWWFKPLKNTGTTPRWKLEPTAKSQFARLE
jgi:hypothetical protein